MFFVSFVSFRNDGYFLLASLYKLLDALFLHCHLESKQNILSDLTTLEKKIALFLSHDLGRLSEGTA